MNSLSSICSSSRQLRYLVLLFFLSPLLLSGCARKTTQLIPPRLHPNKEFVVIRDYETTWNALIRAFNGKKGGKVQTTNKKFGEIVLEPVTVNLEAYCDCGKLGDTPLAGHALRKASVRVKKRAPQETLVVVLCNYTTIYQWKDNHGRTMRRETIPCISNGQYELELYECLTQYMGP